MIHHSFSRWREGSYSLCIIVLMDLSAFTLHLHSVWTGLESAPLTFFGLHCQSKGREVNEILFSVHSNNF